MLYDGGKEGGGVDWIFGKDELVYSKYTTKSNSFSAELYTMKLKNVLPTGTYSYKTRVKADGKWISDWSALKTFDVVDNHPPVIQSFTATPDQGPASLTVNFTCTATDEEGPLAEYRWDFDGDGIFDQTTTTSTATFTFDYPGTYRSRVEVVDGQGARRVSAWHVIHVFASTGTWQIVGMMGHHILSLVVDPTDNQDMLAGTDEGIYRSIDGGAHWYQMANTMSTKAVKALAMDPQDPMVIYAGTTEGIYKSSDGGVTWVNISNNLPDTNITSISIDPTDHRIIYVGTANGGIFKLVP